MLGKAAKQKLFDKVLKAVDAKKELLSTREALLVAATFEETLKQLEYEKNNLGRSKHRALKHAVHKKKYKDRLEKIIE
jgi:uncharacterized membrane protein